jgi:cytochrome c peroxidase
VRAGSPCIPDQVLPLAIGRFKTPTLRDRAQSQPYLHTDCLETIEKVLDFYRHTSLLARAGRWRNANPALGAISMDADEKDLAAFLRSLNEDYD